MEIGILWFSFGILLAMLIAAFSTRLVDLCLFLCIPIFVVCLWYFWATVGAQNILIKVKAANVAAFKLEEGHVKTNKTDQPGETDLSASSETLTALGQTGDLFGGINALFAALAFAGVAVAAIIQARSLQLAREQQDQQSFEPLFFRLLELHQTVSAPKFNLRSRLTAKGRGIVGPDGIEQAVEFARAIEVLRRAIRLKTVALKMHADKSRLMAGQCAAYYDFFYKSNQEQLGPHFRTLFQIFKLIDSSRFKDDVKCKYANIARSTLGKDQLFLLAVNCLSIHGQKFKPLVEKYGLLKHVACDPMSHTIDEVITGWCYHPDAQLGAKFRSRRDGR